MVDRNHIWSHTESKAKQQLPAVTVTELLVTVKRKKVEELAPGPLFFIGKLTGGHWWAGGKGRKEGNTRKGAKIAKPHKVASLKYFNSNSSSNSNSNSSLIISC